MGSFVIGELYAVSVFALKSWEFAILEGAIEVFRCWLRSFLFCFAQIDIFS